MTALALRSPALSSAVPALRLQRVVARPQERATEKDIAESRERVRQIVRGAAARGKAAPDPQADAVRLERALRLAAGGVADGDAKAISLLLNLVDRLRLSCDPGHPIASPPENGVPQVFGKPRFAPGNGAPSGLSDD